MLALALAQPASAQIFGGGRQDAAILQLQQQVAAMQAQLGGPDGASGLVAAHAATQADLATAKTRLTDLEQTLRTLNGSLETLTGELAQARRDLAAARSDGDALRERLARFESAQAAVEVAAPPAVEVAAPPPPPPEPPRARSNDPDEVYAEARRLMSTGQFEQSTAAFTDYLTRFPNRPNAAEARYWLGETLYVRENHPDAAQAYIAALRGWPKTAWAPDAVVKLSSTLVQLKQPAEACKSLVELDRRYAAASAAVKARAQAVKTSAKCA